MLPEEISFREADDLITRACSNLAVRDLINRKRVIKDDLDIYHDVTLETIAKGTILSAIQSAKSSLEPMAAAIMGRFLATEADPSTKLKRFREDD